MRLPTRSNGYGHPQTCSSLSADVRFGKEKGAEEQEEQERLGRTGGHPG